MIDSGLHLTQQQKLQQRLTPMQVRYVRMLEMSGPEFEEEVRNALDEMPALEAISESPATSSTSLTEDGSEFTESARDIQMADYRSDDDIPDYLRRQMTRTSQALPEDYYEPSIVNPADSLVETLSRQLDEMSLPPIVRMAAEYVVGNLDDNGYLTRHPAAIADDITIAEGVEVTPATVKEGWDAVRRCDPAGIGAVDLRDSLLLQLQRMPRSVESIAAIEMLRDYFDLFAKKHFSRIKTAMGIDDKLLREAITLIGRLNPKPASLLESTGGGAARAVVPDFLVDVDADDNIHLSLLNRIPELAIEQTFAPDAPLPNASTAATASARTFIRQKRDEAADFIKVVGMRQQTLFKVMSAIVNVQRRFFLTDDEAEIRPMVLRELADATGLDITVISRATQGKYVMTPRGIYPLKMFFNERRVKDLPPEETEDNTTPRVLAAIKEAIASEDPRHPLSDLNITRRLASQGLDIARRTVTKYREKLGYPVARLRRQL